MKLQKREIPTHKGYEITEDGQVYNITRKAWLKPYRGKLGYYTFRLDGKHKLVHRLVAITYLGEPPQDGLKYEVDHIDENKGNNHFTNLQWISHSDNVRKSYKLGTRGCWWLGKSRPSFSLEHRRKMANAKFKSIKIYKDGKLLCKLPSIEETAAYFGVTRITIWMKIKHREGKHNGCVLTY